MRPSLLSLLMLAALPALAESIVYEPCTEQPPWSAYERPQCADYELNTQLIESVETGDASALALLEARYAMMESYEERHRLAEVLLRRVPDDSAIWKEIYANAQLAVRFAEDEDDAGLERWCEAHDCQAQRHGYVLYSAFGVAAHDPRSRALLVQALGSRDRELAFTAVCGLAVQRDLASLDAIDKTLARYPEEADSVARVLVAFHDPRADAIMQKYVRPEPEEEEVEEEAEEDEETEEQ